MPRPHRPSRRRLVFASAVLLLGAGIVCGAIINLTMNDLFLPGTQMGQLPESTVMTSNNCQACHGGFDPANEHMTLWKGSLMGQAGRDPLFFAQMTTANQDAANAGYFCMRCHVPLSFISGHAMPADGSLLSIKDRDGVTCHFCHTMVDPVYRPGISPPEDMAILDGLTPRHPGFYGNAMFVTDPNGVRRGPRADHEALHDVIVSPFHARGDFCGTCHDVGNVAVSRRPDGTYRYNSLDTPAPSLDLATQFPLERTYTEWRLSQFAATGVDMGGRFGGTRGPVVSTCQDCHMPRVEAQNTPFSPVRPDMARHEFAGASAQVLDLIALQGLNDPDVDQDALATGRAAAVSMLRRAASLDAAQDGPTLRVRVTNETGHKIPTGHIEGRRIWVHARFLSADGALLSEHGAYDNATAELDESTTTVYEMKVGLSADAAATTGLPAGPTGHMALADTIELDNRIPPRGFSNAAYTDAGAPVVGWEYADGQYWDDLAFPVPPGAASAEVELLYQSTPKHYIDMLRDNNHTDSRGEALHSLWEQTGRGAPVQMATRTIPIGPRCNADFNADGQLTGDDVFALADAIASGADPANSGVDFNRDGVADLGDVFDMASVIAGGDCP